jgi:pimeloyl-ACP methyl ester carboxylesterase
LHHPGRVSRIFAFAANTDTTGVTTDAEKTPVFGAYIQRAGQEYATLSPTPRQYDGFVQAISHMWATQPNWTAARLRTIHTPVLVVDGDHDEAIRRPHTEMMARTIPGARLLILPDASHFAFLQDPAGFNAAVLAFLGG